MKFKLLGTFIVLITVLASCVTGTLTPTYMQTVQHHRTVEPEYTFEYVISHGDFEYRHTAFADINQSLVPQFYPKPDNPDNIRIIEQITSELYRILPRPQSGFNYDYYLFIPSSVNTSKTNHLLVSPIASAGVDNADEQYYSDWVRNRFVRGSVEAIIARELRLPTIQAAFPRTPEFYVAGLTHGVMGVHSKYFSRPDLQMIAMIDDAKEILSSIHQISTKEQVFMSGYSMSGSFTHRFSLLHPELLAGIAFGGESHTPMIPFTHHAPSGTALIYTAGVADIHRYTGKEFDREAYLAIPKLYVEGYHDRKDLTFFGGLYIQEMGEWIREHMGLDFDDRWASYERLLTSIDSNLTMIRYPNLGHEIEVNDYIDFFRSIIAEEHF